MTRQTTDHAVQFGALRASLHAARDRELDSHILSLLHHAWRAWPDEVERVWLPYTRAHMAARALSGATLWSSHAVFHKMLQGPGSAAWEVARTLSLQGARPSWRKPLWDVWRVQRCHQLERLELILPLRGVNLRECLPGAHRAPWRLRELVLDTGWVRQADIEWLADAEYLEHVEYVKVLGLPEQPYRFFDALAMCTPNLEAVALESLPSHARTLHTLRAAELLFIPDYGVELRAPSSQTLARSFTPEQIQAAADHARATTSDPVDLIFDGLLESGCSGLILPTHP